MFSHPGMSNSLWPRRLQHARPLSFTISWSLPKFMSIAPVMSSSHLILWRPLLLLPSIFPSIKDSSIESMTPSNHLILCRRLLLPSIFLSIRVFSSESAFLIRWPKYWSFNEVHPMNIQGWFPLGLTGLISLLSKGLSGVFSSTTVRRHQFFSALPSLRSISHNRTWPLGRP